MKLINALVVGALLVLSLWMYGACREAHYGRVVSVVITAQLADGAPADGLLLSLRRKGRDSVISGKTDAQGTWTHSVQVDDGDTEIAFEIDRATHAFLPEAHPDKVRMDQLLGGKSWPGEQVFPVSASESSVSRVITADLSSQVRGRVIGLSAPAKAFAVVGGEWTTTNAQNDGIFLCPSLPRSKEVCVFVSNTAYGYAKPVVTTTSAISGGEVNIGDVLLTEHSGVCRVNITTSDRDHTNTASKRHRFGVTLVAEDGSAVFAYKIPKDGVVAVGGPQTGGVGVPAGVYFVIPGSILSGGPDKAVRLLQNGRSAELVAAGIPRVTAQESHDADVSIASGLVWNAVRLLCPD